MTVTAKTNLNWLWLSVVIVVLDQVTKYLAESFLLAYQPIEFTSFFNLTLAYNTGAAFSFLDDAGGWQQWLFGTIAVIVTGISVRWLYTLPSQAKWHAVALSLIVGGAAGNVIDRITRQQVVDFLDFHLGAYHWPVFNIADAAITVGVAILVVILFTSKEPDPR